MNLLKAIKPINIPKKLVWQAYQKVRANKGAAGIDKETLNKFEKSLFRNLYKIWNRMSSGTYFPPPVKGVPIPKKKGGTRLLGVPTVSDRIAQETVRQILEPILEKVFDKDSYGYRKGKSAHDALKITRERCWQYDWVVEFDIKGLFDNIDHDLLLKALKHHCKIKWVLLYVERWLKASIQMQDKSIVERDKGTPQGGIVSPILANLFMHYVFDVWIRRKMPNIPLCRYADDGILHCRSYQEAEEVLRKIIERFKECGLEIHPEKSQIVYCRDGKRRRKHKVKAFDFLGYTFRPRMSMGKDKRIRCTFLPAISKTSQKAINREIKSWKVQLRNDKEIKDLSRMFNPKIRGWFNYYGQFYPSRMRLIWCNLNGHLLRWVRRKYRRFKKCKQQATTYLKKVAYNNPNMFLHWKLGILPCV
jgi:RNA-directed DNA polymerase